MLIFFSWITRTTVRRPRLNSEPPDYTTDCCGRFSKVTNVERFRPTSDILAVRCLPLAAAELSCSEVRITKCQYQYLNPRRQMELSQSKMHTLGAIRLRTDAPIAYIINVSV